MNAEELRRRGLNFARRQIAAGRATKQDVERWEKEYGPEIHPPTSPATQSAPSRRPARAATPSPSDTSKE